MIVVDTNIICYRWMPFRYSEQADKAWAKDPQWLVPLLWRSEFRSVLAGSLRRKLITMEAAIHVLQMVEAQFAEREFLVSSRAVMRLVAGSRCSAYDCEFVALAQEYGVRLLTADRQVLKDFNDVAIALDQFARL